MQVGDLGLSRSSLTVSARSSRAGWPRLIALRCYFSALPIARLPVGTLRTDRHG